MALSPRFCAVFQALIIAGSLSAAGSLGHKGQDPPAEAVKLIWHPPPPMTASDWYWGPGGKEKAPVPPFQFLKEDFSGTSPKVKVLDARGATWTVRHPGPMGRRSRPSAGGIWSFGRARSRAATVGHGDGGAMRLCCFLRG